MSNRKLIQKLSAILTGIVLNSITKKEIYDYIQDLIEELKTEEKLRGLNTPPLP